MSTLKQLKKRWLRNPEFRRAYASLKPEIAIARQLIAARSRAGLSHVEVARRMGTTQSTVTRLESGKRLPSVSSLSRYAKAIGCKIQFRLLPTG